MKKIVLSLGLVALSTGFVMAQAHDHDHDHDHSAHAQQAATETTLTVENMVFNEEVHDFGTIPEGPAAEVEFTFKNTGDEPILIQNVRPSCGCTTPSWSKDPVLPGKTGTIKASYGTKGRPNGFNKSITVTSNAGTKVLSIKGTVEPAPAGSVPTTSSMIKN